MIRHIARKLRGRKRPARSTHPAALKGTIFIVTYGRSGSTLLQSILQTIPGCHIVGENYATLPPLLDAAARARRTHATWGKKDRPPNHPWHGADQLTPERFEAALVDLFVSEVLRPPPGTRWYGFKEIRYAKLGDDLPETLDTLRRVFPNAFIVFNSRDADAVAKSGWWGKSDPDRARRLVARMDARFAQYTRDHPDDTHWVHHEDTVANPESLRPLFEKLGETLDIDAVHRVLANRLAH